MTTITAQLSNMELKLGQATLLRASSYSKNSNLSLLPSITPINKDLVSVGCPPFFQDYDTVFLAILGIFLILEYKTNTINIKRFYLLCL